MLTDTELFTRIQTLPDTVKADVLAYIESKLNATSNETQVDKLRKGGWAKGMIIIHDDFDEPLEEFKEYME